MKSIVHAPSVPEGQSSGGQSSGGPPVRRSRVLAALSAAAFLACAAGTAWWSRGTEVERSAHALAVSARTGARQFDLALRNADAILLSAERAAKGRSFLPEEDAGDFRRRLWATEELSTLIVSDKEGWVAAPLTAEATGPGFSVAEREFFLWWREHPKDPALHVSPPSTSKITGRQVVVVSRPRLGPDGEFQGVVTGALNQAYLDAVLSSALGGRSGTGGLLMEDGMFLARAPVSDGAVGRRAPDPKAASMLAAEPWSQESAGFRIDSPSFDGIVRHVALQRVGGRSLVVAATLSEDEALEGWRRWVALILAAGLPICAGGLWIAALADRRESERLGLLERLAARNRGLEGNLRSKAALYRDLVEAQGEFVVRVGTDGRMSFANRAFQDAFGTGDPVGTEWSPFVVEEDRAAVAAALAEAFSSPGRRVRVEARSDLRSGRRVVEWDGGAVLDASGEAVEVQAVGRDATALREAEGALRAAARAAEEANAAKSSFLAVMSHEIRTPMNGVLGMARLLADDPGLDPPRRERARAVVESGSRLLTILNGVLDLAKVEAGAMEIEAAAMDLAEVARHAVATMRPAAEAKGLVLSLSLEDGLRTARIGDPLRLGQVLANLIGNAVKFSPKGNVRVEISEARDLSGGRSRPSDRVRLRVSDEGIGMDADALAKIFAPFSQADSSTTRRFGGTGLGLSIVKGLVEAMGGTISVESEAGRGSAFTVALDLPESDGTRPGGEGEAAALPPPDLSGRRVLVADDDPTNRLVAQGLLEALGAEVAFAEDGLRAVGRVREEAFDLVLMDQQMPRMDGLEAVRILRAEGSRVPIAAATAGAMASDRGRCLEAGMDAYLSKPIVPSELHAVLRSLLGGGPKDAASPGPSLPPEPSSPDPAPPPAATPVAPAPPAPILPDAVEGIDMEAGLELFAGMAPLYKTILSGFEKAADGYLEDILSGMESGDLERAHRASHTLKGILGQIAAPAGRAAELDDALREGRTADAAVLYGDVAEQVGSLARAIRAALA